jgi:hypothetical protein
MKTLTIIALLAVTIASHAGEAIPLPKTGWQENFNGFQGTHASLPKGIIVSKDGQAVMVEDDADFRGINDGDLSTGGCYAWEVGTNDYALGYQPTTSEFTPGYFEVAFSNSSDTVYNFISMRYDLVTLNNEDSSFKLQLQLLRVGMPAVDSATIATTAAQDDPAHWTRTRVSCYVQLEKPIQPGEMFSIRWYGDDGTGSGARDELGIDNLRISGIASRGTVITIR